MYPDIDRAMAERRKIRKRRAVARAVLRVLAATILAILLMAAIKAVTKKGTTTVEACAVDAAEEPVTVSEITADAYLKENVAHEAEEVSSMVDEAKEALPSIDEAEVEMLACRIYWEAGGDGCSDLCRYYCGDVMLNRVNDPRFPDTLEDVLTQRGQYGRFYWTGIVWPERAKNPGEANAVQRAYDTARDLLSGNHSALYGAGYIYQAEFKQGKEVIFLDGTYFGK